MNDEITPIDNENLFRPADDVDADAQLQKELDEALGDSSLMDLMDTPAERPARRSSGAGSEIQAGAVLAVQDDTILVELSPKAQGILPVKQFEDEPVPAEGDIVEFTVEGYNDSEGLWMLSRQGAILAATWETIEVGKDVEGRVTGHNKGGIELDVNGIDAFMPVSQIERFGGVEDMSQYVGQKLQCQIVEIDNSRSNSSLLVSRRALLDAQAELNKEALFETLQEGAVVSGVVRNIMPYGAFVDIGGADGLLHVRDMSHARVEKPEDVVSVGQELKLSVLKVDREEKKIALGLKQAMPDPWDSAAVQYPVGEIVSGRVVKLMNFGAFVELTPGVEGLVPISELTFERRVAHPREVVNEGDVIKIRVMSVDLDRKRISLSLKQVGDDPWVGAAVRWAPDSIVEGVVTREADFGAFVQLVPGVEGMVHISELSEQRVNRVGEVAREGETIKAKVISVDEEARRISLSIKQLATSDDYAFSTEDDDQPAAPPKKRKTPLKGGLGDGGLLIPMPEGLAEDTGEGEESEEN
ncbi:MAG: S1 RNA-binding domain-containing protein [Phycisphaerae bacterium]|nr:S1 RNA-binding domain-containing protein [Planctomycetota bacterium]MBL7222098.1 S1 RNA-binding domain-containing protein [Phycisphaerae bacterium]